MGQTEVKGIVSVREIVLRICFFELSNVKLRFLRYPVLTAMVRIAPKLP